MEQVNAFKAANTDANSSAPTNMTADQVAYGFIQVANEAMCRPIRYMCIYVSVRVIACV